MSPPNGLDYVGLKPCGCIGIWVSEQFGTPKEIAKEVAVIVKRGLDLHRMTTAETRRLPFRCSVCDPQPQLEFGQ